MAEALKTELTVDLADQLTAARERARAIVAASSDGIARFAAILEAAGELTGEELAAAIAEAGFFHPGPA